MKKWMTLPLVMISLMAPLDAAVIKCCSEHPNDLVFALPAGMGCWKAHVDLLYWKPRVCGLDYLWPSNITRFDVACDGNFSTDEPDKILGKVMSVGKGGSKNVDLEHELGWRIGFETQCDCVNFTIRFTKLDSDETDSWHRGKKHHAKQKNAVSQFPVPYTPARMHPDIKGFVDRTNIFAAKAEYDIDFHQLDFEARHDWSLSCGNVGLLAGVRLARIDQEMHSSYYGKSLPFGEEEMGGQSSRSVTPVEVETRVHTVKENNDMKSWGVYAGLQGDWNIWSCFSLFGRVATGASLANFDRTFHEKEFSEIKNANYPLQYLVDAKKDDWCHVRHTEFVIGGDLLLCNNPGCGEWHLHLGYETHTWSDMRNFLQFVDHHEKGGNVRATDSLGFEGPFLRLIASY